MDQCIIIPTFPMSLQGTDELIDSLSTFGPNRGYFVMALRVDRQHMGDVEALVLGDKGRLLWIDANKAIFGVMQAVQVPQNNIPLDLSSLMKKGR